MCDTASQLTDGFQLLCVTKRLFGIPQPLLIAHAVSHVIDKLVGTDTVAVTIAQGAVAHLVSAAIPLWITEFRDLRKLLASQRAAPHGFDCCAMLRLRSEQVEHARPHCRALAKDAFEFV
jgi:hypothetical protein